MSKNSRAGWRWGAGPDLMVFMQFYRQSVTWLRRHDALLGGLCSFGLTFSDDSGPPDALVCIFVVRDGPEDGKTPKKVAGNWCVSGPAGNH